MRSVEEIKEFVNNSKIAGRYHRKSIRDWLRTHFPDEPGFIFYIPIFRESDEITYQQFKEFVNEEEV